MLKKYLGLLLILFLTGHFNFLEAQNSEITAVQAYLKKMDPLSVFQSNYLDEDESVFVSQSDENQIHLDLLKVMEQDPAFGSKLVFSSTMIGDEVVPSVSTNGQGVAGFTLNETLDQIEINMTLDGLSSPVTAVHINEGLPGTNGSPIINLTQHLVGSHLTLTLTEFDLGQWLSGKCYVNVLTDNWPDGEIRGQIKLEQDRLLQARAFGQQVVPPVTTSGVSLSFFSWDENSHELSYSMVFKDLIGDISSIGLYVGPYGSNGPLISTLSESTSANSLSGKVDCSSFEEDLLLGRIYMSIHTTAFEDGELRAQLMPVEGFSFDLDMTTDQVVENVESEARAVGYASLTASMEELNIFMIASDLSSDVTSVEIRYGLMGSNGAMVQDVTSSYNNGALSHTLTEVQLDSEFVTRMFTGKVYVLIRTVDFPNGELRGQFFRAARDAYSIELCGYQEVPAVSSSGIGTAVLSINKEQTQFEYKLVTSGNASITSITLNEGVVGENGPELFNLTANMNDNGAFGFINQDDGFDLAISSSLKNQRSYINVSTTGYSNGELRGQVVTTLGCLNPLLNLEQSSTSIDMQVFPNPANSIVTINIPFSQGLDLNVYDMHGKVVMKKPNLRAESFQLDISRLSRGFYLLVLDDGMKTAHYKLIKE